ncbi:MAG: 4Fe-4S binding protein [Rhodospirillales bacterium]
MNILRRIVQWTAIALLLALPLLSRGGALFEAYGRGASYVGQMAGPWEQALYAGFSRLMGGFEDPTAVADLFQGSYWSITLFGFTISDPLAFLGHAVATGTVHWPLIAGTALSVGLALVAGRFFCGWVCPVNTLLELNAKLRARIERWMPLPRLDARRLPPGMRWGVLIAAVAVSGVAGFNAFAYVLPYAALARDWHLAVYGQAIGFGVLFLLIVALVELLVAPRLWCRSLCPTGLVLGIIGHWRLFGIRRKPDGACVEGCHACIAACPVAVNPRDEIVTDRCLLCNTCVERCPAAILTTGPALRRPRGRAGRRLGAALVLALAALLPAGAAAHHVKGLPHYGYIENYPQIPTRETRIEAPPYEVTLVTYALEGIDRSRSDRPDDVIIFVSVTDTRTGKAHTGELSVAFTPLGGGAPMIRDFRKPLEETVYRARAVLPAAAYDVKIRIGGANGPGVVVAETRLHFEDGIDPMTAVVLGVLGAAALGIGTLALSRRLRRRTLPGVGKKESAGGGA